jgi:acyl-CoA reductase-like NAD-dependent aldehyde dehydrogenase
MLHDSDLVSVQEVRTKVDKAYEAWQVYKTFSQAQVDAVVEAVAAAGRAHAQRLAELAVEETGYGNVADKYAKNMLCSDLLPQTLRGMLTVGVLREIPEKRITEIGVPVGVVAAILPTTNPTSTVFYKTIISLKAGNAVVLSPHPRAKGCTCAAAAIAAEAATKAGAPDGLVQCIGNSTLEGTNALMRHPKTGVILATGGSGMVRAAYSSGKPAFGVGPGNVPVYLDPQYDTTTAVAAVVEGKSFDFGTVCSSEQTLVADRSRRDEVLAALKANHAMLLDDSQRAAVERTLFTSGASVRPDCVGQSPQKIAQMAGFTAPAEARILVAEIQGVGKGHPLSAEKWSPVLALLFVDGFEAGIVACEQILYFGGLGHTAVIHSSDEARVRQFGLRMPAYRVLVNTPAPGGSVGMTTFIQPSMTLGCGAIAGNITSDNVSPLHLINIKRIAWKVREAGDPLDAAAPVAAAAITREAVSAVVERYLTERGIVSALSASKLTVQAAPVAPACGCSAQPAAAGAYAPAPAALCAPGAPAPVPAPPVAIVDFVCESDVRAAIAAGRKIFIGPRTIVTPSARELAGRDEILVQAER